MMENAEMERRKIEALGHSFYYECNAMTDEALTSRPKKTESAWFFTDLGFVYEQKPDFPVGERVFEDFEEKAGGIEVNIYDIEESKRREKDTVPVSLWSYGYCKVYGYIVEAGPEEVQFPMEIAERFAKFAKSLGEPVLDDVRELNDFDFWEIIEALYNEWKESERER